MIKHLSYFINWVGGDEGAILVWCFFFLFLLLPVSHPPPFLLALGSSMYRVRIQRERVVHTAYVSQLATMVIFPQDIEQRTHTNIPLFLNDTNGKLRRNHT